MSKKNKNKGIKKNKPTSKIDSKIKNEESKEIITEEILNAQNDIEDKKQDNQESSVKEKDLIYSFAYCGGQDFFNQQIEHLSTIAEPESWSNREDGLKHILKSYIVKTFERCSKLQIINISADGNWSCFNTGLMTINGQDIIGLFTKNSKPNQQEWYFKGFKTASDRDFLNNFTEVPDIASYTDNPNDYYFDTNQEITLSIDHILDDNFERYPEEIKKLGKEILKSLLSSAFEATKKKIKRNNRLVIPQFYNEKFSYLMPIKIPVSDNKYVTMALAVEKMALGNYRANTIFTTEMAYSKARLVMKPESNWLMENEKE